MLGSTIDAGARRSGRAGRSRGACARLARGREGRARASVTNGTGAWPWERRARRAAARTRRWGIAERHAPGGELLRDDGGHLDFRLMCLKLLRLGTEYAESARVEDASRNGEVGGGFVGEVVILKLTVFWRQGCDLSQVRPFKESSTPCLNAHMKHLKTAEPSAEKTDFFGATFREINNTNELSD